MKTMGAAQFKAHCLAILDRLEAEGLVITKHGKPVARLMPIRSTAAEMIGSLRGRLRVKGAILSTGRKWDAGA